MKDEKYTEEEYTEENTIIEIDDEFSEDEDTENFAKVNEDKEEIVVDLKKEKKAKNKKKKVKKASFWSRLSKKGKIIVISGISLLLLIIAGILVYFLCIKKDKKVTKEENVPIEKDNYIYENGKLKFLGDSGEVIGTYTCKSKSDKKCYVAYYSDEDKFDLPVYEYEDGTKIEKRAKIYNNKYVFVSDQDKIFLYDIKKSKSTGEYKLVKTGDIEDPLVVLKDKDDKYGLVKITSSGIKNILDFKYEYLGIYNLNNTFVVKEKGSSYLVDEKGEEVSKKITGEIKSFNSKYISVFNENYYLYDYDGVGLLGQAYDYIDFNSEYIFVIDGIKLYAYDNELVKLNESPIKLKSTDYSKTYIFDKDNNLKETKKAYGTTITGSSIEFELAENNIKKINLYEAKVNKAYDYVNYFDGALYFYDDEAKTSLIGSYTCTNKNIIASENDTFANCFVAMESKIINEASSGYVPIINNNFVYIKDVKETTSSTIVLYDIAKGKKLSKYSMIDTGIGNENITHISVQNNIIYAKNIDGYYGAITFENSGPKGLIPFKDESGNGTSKMSKLGDNILVKIGNTNYLYDKIGVKLATSTFDIVDYKNKYTVVKNPSGKYLIYVMSNGTSGKILTDEYDFIELYDKFFVGINNKKLNVYYYTNAKDKLLTEDIEVSSNSSKAYKISETASGYTLNVTAGESATVDYSFDKNWSKLANEE